MASVPHDPRLQDRPRIAVPRAVDERWLGVPILRCARCGGPFAGRPRFCPSCGVAFARSGRVLRAASRRRQGIAFMAGVAVGLGGGLAAPLVLTALVRLVGVLGALGGLGG